MNWPRAGEVDKDRNIELTTSDFHQDKKQPEKKKRKRMSMGEWAESDIYGIHMHPRALLNMGFRPNPNSQSAAPSTPKQLKTRAEGFRMPTAPPSNRIHPTDDP